jgi:hypothetical protein
MVKARRRSRCVVCRLPFLGHEVCSVTPRRYNGVVYDPILGSYPTPTAHCKGFLRRRHSVNRLLIAEL